MKRLMFLISLLIAGQVFANTKTVVIGDTAYFNYRHSSAIDSAQLILMRGAVNDTLSLMPIVGTSHKICEWEGVFNQVDSSGTYQVWIEPYSSAAIIDTILGDCLVELAARDVNMVQMSGDPTAADNLETMLDGTGGQIMSLRGLHIIGTAGNDTAIIARGYGDGDGFHVKSGVTGGAAMRLLGSAVNLDLVATLNLADVTGQVDSNKFADDYWDAVGNKAASGADSTAVFGAIVEAFNDSALVDTGWVAQDPEAWTADDTAAYRGAATVPDSLLEVATKVRSLLMNPLPGSILPNGHLQVDWNADSTDIAGYSPPQGTEFYLTSRRAFEGYERSLYLENASLNTLKMKLDTGYYEMAAQIWFASATTDTAYFQCYNSANDPQTWLSSGTGVEYAVGWTGWHRFARLIRLTGDSTFYFTIGANAGDSAYFAEVSLMPYGAVGHTITVASGSGPRLCSLMVVDATPAAITDGTVSMTSGATVWSADISGDGFAVFGLTDATWSGLAYATGYAQDTIPQTFTVTASMRDTITMTAISIPAASAPNMVNAYIYTYDIAGDTVVGARMEITPNGRPPFRDTDSNIVMIPRLVSAHSNTDGLVQQEIVRSSEATDLNGNNVTYNFKITKGNYFSALFENRTAPDSASWQIK